MSKVLSKGEIKSKDFLVFIGIVVFMLGAIFYSKNNMTDQQTILGDNVVWVELNDTQMDLWVRNTDDIYGIQFEFNGVNFISKGKEGFLIDNKFEASHNDRMILAFSFQGKSIPPGEHKLINLNLSYLNGKHNVSIKNMVVAGEGGKSLDYSYFDTNVQRETYRTN